MLELENFISPESNLWAKWVDVKYVFTLNRTRYLLKLKQKQQDLTQETDYLWSNLVSTVLHYNVTLQPEIY